MQSSLDPRPRLQLPAILFALIALAVGSLIGVLAILVGEPILIIGGIAALAGLSVALIRPDLGVLVLIIMTFTRMSDILIEYHNLPSTAQPFIAILAVATAIHWLLDRRRPVGWQGPAMWLGAYGVVIFASQFYADASELAQQQTIDFFKDSLPAILVVLLIQRAEHLRRAAWALIGVGIVLGTISSFQYLTGSFDQNYWGFGQARTSSLGGDGGYRITGPFNDAPFFAQMLVVIAPIAFERMLHSPRQWQRVIAGYATAVTVLTLLLTFSRGGFLALAIVAIFQVARTPPKPIAVGIGLIFITALLAIAPANYVDRIATIFQYAPIIGQEDFRNEASFRGRSSELIVAWQMFRDNPILGVGIGNYNANYVEYSSRLGIDPRLEARSAHSLYLEIAAETGIVGLCVFFGLVGSVFLGLHRAQKRLLRYNLAHDAALVRAIELGLIGFLAAGIFLHLAFARPFWILIGLAMSVVQVARTEAAEALKVAQS